MEKPMKVMLGRGASRGMAPSTGCHGRNICRTAQPRGPEIEDEEMTGEPPEFTGAA